MASKHIQSCLWPKRLHRREGAQSAPERRSDRSAKGGDEYRFIAEDEPRVFWNRSRDSRDLKPQEPDEDPPNRKRRLSDP